MIDQTYRYWLYSSNVLRFHITNKRNLATDPTLAAENLSALLTLHWPK